MKFSIVCLVVVFTAAVAFPVEEKMENDNTSALQNDPVELSEIDPAGDQFNRDKRNY